MFVQPPKFVTTSISEKVDASKVNEKGSSLDRPKIAAVHLKTAEDLKMFYGQSQSSAFTAVAVWTFQAVTFVVGTILAAVGCNVGSSDGLNKVPPEDVSTMNIDNLLNARLSVLESL